MKGTNLFMYSPPEVDRTWLWVHATKISICPIFYLLKGHDISVCLQLGERQLHSSKKAGKAHKGPSLDPKSYCNGLDKIHIVS